MRPKLSGRFNQEGEQIYSYLCTMKEKSRMKCCGMNNPNGNLLDQMVLEEIKKITENKDELALQLNQYEKLLDEGRQESEADILRLNEDILRLDEEISGLVSSLKKAGGTAAEEYIVAQIEELHQRKEDISGHLERLKVSLINQELSDGEAELVKRTLSSFSSTLDTMDVEQKRMAVRAFIKRAVWDGKNIHLYFLGSKEPSGESSK